jgi:hypothetical protein
MGDPLLGIQLGSFRLVKRLGGGGMGNIYLGRQIFIGSKVAVKVLHPHLAKVPELVERFQAEALAVNLIKHENIVSIFDMGRLPDGAPYLVMEYLEGMPLSELCRWPVPEKVAFPILAQVCDALDAAHYRGVVHQDLKPENIFLVRSHHQEHFVKLLDFGIAQLLESPLGSPRRPGRLVVGTPGYMAPEQLEGRAVDGRADIFALGVIAYLLSTGELPFEGMKRGAPRPPRAVNPVVSEDWSDAILKAIATRPEDRYPDAGAFRRSLQDALTEVEERPPAPQLDAFAAAALDDWTRRATRDHYGLLGCADDCRFDDVRTSAREARRELETLRTQPLDDRQRAVLAAIVDRMTVAAEMLESPARRAEYDAARGNYRGVARCIVAGLGAGDLDMARKRYLAEQCQSEVVAQAHAASAQAHLRGGRVAEAMRELGQALEADPLNLPYHRLYWSLRRRTLAAALGGAASPDGQR